jgi:hypothetical protein
VSLNYRAGGIRTSTVLLGKPRAIMKDIYLDTEAQIQASKSNFKIDPPENSW